MKIRLDLGALLVTLVLVAFLVPGPARAQDTPSDRLSAADWLDWERVGDARISPDGRQIVYTRSWVDKQNDRFRSSIWIMSADGTRNRHLIDGSSPRWSPDGTRLAFLDQDDDDNTQIFVRWMDDEGAVSQVTRVTESPGDVAWSPDGESLAFSMRTDPESPARGDWSIDLPKPEGADWTPAPRIVERLVYRHDGVGFVDETWEHLFVVPASGGTPRQITSGDWDHSDPVWTPDGSALLFDGLRVPDAGYMWKEQEIYAADVMSRQITQLTTRKGPDSNPLPSPDGRYIAYQGHDTTGMDYIEDAIYVMEADGSNPTALTEEMDRSPGQMFWASDSEGIYFNLESEGHENLFFVDLDGNVRQVTEGAHMLAVSDLSPDGMAVGELEGPTDPEDLVAFHVDRPSQRRMLTAVNDDVLHGKELGEVEEIWYTSTDDFRIQGWIIKPPDFDPSREYPMMLVIHGGPHAAYDIGFSFGWQEHAAHDYVVLYTNPRGSSAYGSEFGNAIQNAYPGDDFHDLMAGVDTVVNRGYVDEDNMFVYGCSGGGVLTAWVVGHTDRFRAASSNCPVIDWVSFPGNVDGNYLRWYADFEHFPWVDASEHLRRSPLMYVGNVTTPTMLMTGVLDMRTPISQTEEFYQALKAQKKPTAMIRFNDEWHGTSSNPSNFIRTQMYLRKWFERWGDHDDRP